MKYVVQANTTNLELSADNSKVFFEEFAKLPAGEYTVTVLSDESRSGRCHSKSSTMSTMAIVNMVLEALAILLMLASIVPLWIIGCALI